MPLLVLAYPRLAPEGLSLIQQVRLQHDQRFFNVVAPHFTLVFPLGSVQAGELGEHVAAQAAATPEFPFVLRCALVVEDAFGGQCHVQLVPDEGFSRLVKLHDALYTGLLAPELRRELAYVPHITVGRSADRERCEELAAQLNARDLEIPGQVRALDLVAFEGKLVRSVRQIPLVAAGS